MQQNITKCLLFFSLIIFLPQLCKAQSLDECKEVMIADTVHHESVYKVNLDEIDSEFQLLYRSLFVFYKKFVSSQDASSCSFTPSCSEYAAEAIKKQGFIKGYINFWDRFSRCTGMSTHQYEVDDKKKLLKDPVKDFHNEVL